VSSARRSSVAKDDRQESNISITGQEKL